MGANYSEFCAQLQSKDNLNMIKQVFPLRRRIETIGIYKVIPVIADSLTQQ